MDREYKIMIDYFFYKIKDQIYVCLFCHKRIQTMRRDVLGRHYKNQDNDLRKNTIGEERINHAENMKFLYLKKLNFFARKENTNKEVEINLYKRTKQEQILLYCIRNNLGIRGYLKLKEINKIIGENQDLTFTQDIYYKTLYSLGKTYKSQVFVQIKNSSQISFSIDETPDMTKTKQISVFIKIFDNCYNTKIHLLELIGTQEKLTGEKIFLIFNQIITDYEIDITKIVSITTDNARNMTGYINGFFAFINKQYPNIKFIPCFLHILNLKQKKINTELVKKYRECYCSVQTKSRFTQKISRCSRKIYLNPL